MQTRSSAFPARKARPATQPAASFVECAVQVSPTLARYIRKCATAEADGSSARDALLSPLGFRGDELALLKEQIKHLSAELHEAREAVEELRQSADAANGVIAKRDKEQLELRRLLREANEKAEQDRANAAAIEKRLAELMGREEAVLRSSISVADMDKHTARAVKKFADRLRHGGDAKKASLAAAGYDLSRIEAAIATNDRDEVRALDALLKRPSWRRRAVLWLLPSADVSLKGRSEEDT
jgi:chromosome segregation ATPase